MIFHPFLFSIVILKKKRMVMKKMWIESLSPMISGQGYLLRLKDLSFRHALYAHGGEFRCKLTGETIDWNDVTHYIRATEIELSTT